MQGIALQFINTVSHRECRCAASARRATEAYRSVRRRSTSNLERMQGPRKSKTFGAERHSNATVFVN
jgi:hypothetical protein